MGVKIEWSKVIIGLLVLLVLVQAGSALVSRVFGVPLLQLGDIIIITLVTIIGGSFLVQMVIAKKADLEKKDVFTALLVAGMLVAFMLLLPKIAPSLFPNLQDWGFSLLSAVTP